MRALVRSMRCSLRLRVWSVRLSRERVRRERSRARRMRVVAASPVMGSMGPIYPIPPARRRSVGRERQTTAPIPAERATREHDRDQAAEQPRREGDITHGTENTPADRRDGPGPGEKVEALRKDTAEVLDRARDAIARARASQADATATFVRIIRRRGRGA
jgi:hypothetical protein